MNIEEIKQLVQSEQYNFLRDNPHLKDKIIFLTLGGSYAYGTNVETSDVDVRGCALNSKNDLLGLSSFEQVVNTETDTVVYSFNKLVSLLLNCNPNTIELLGCKPEHYFFLSDIGKEMIDNRRIFLSQRAAYSFGGYANQQLRRLENAIARDALPQAKREEHIKQSMENSMSAFERKYTAFPEGSIKLYTGESNKAELDREVFADITLTRFPAREFHSIINDMTNIIGCYEKLNGRNRKKDEDHLNKHAMHLIRHGKYQLDDGTYSKEFFDIVNEYEKRLQYAKKNTSLPKTPDYNVIEEFVMDVNRKAIDM